MADHTEKSDSSSDQRNQNKNINNLSADEMRQSEVVLKTRGQRRLIIGILIVGIIAMIVVVMNVAPQ